MPAAAASGNVSSESSASGWDLQSFNVLDPVEVGVAAGLHEYAVANVAGSTASAYVGLWTQFEDWRVSLVVPRCPLPTSEMTVALYLRSVVERSRSYAPVKSPSDAIAFYQKVNMFGHLPTRSPAVKWCGRLLPGILDWVPGTGRSPSVGIKWCPLPLCTG